MHAPARVEYNDMSRDKDKTDAAEFVDSVVKNKNAEASDILEKIVRRKVEKHIRKTLRQAEGR